MEFRNNRTNYSDETRNCDGIPTEKPPNKVQ